MDSSFGIPGPKVKWEFGGVCEGLDRDSRLFIGIMSWCFFCLGCLLNTLSCILKFPEDFLEESSVAVFMRRTNSSGFKRSANFCKPDPA